MLFGLVFTLADLAWGHYDEGNRGCPCQPGLLFDICQTFKGNGMIFLLVMILLWSAHSLNLFNDFMYIHV